MSVLSGPLEGPVIDRLDSQNQPTCIHVFVIKALIF